VSKIPDVVVAENCDAFIPGCDELQFRGRKAIEIHLA